jgi:hypothetical protein
MARWYWATISPRAGGPASTGESVAQGACGGGGGHPAGRVAARATLGTPRRGDFAIAHPLVPANSRTLVSPVGGGAGSRGGIEIALGPGDDATTGLRADGPVRSTNDTNAPMSAAASVTAPAPNASRRPLPLRPAAAGPPGNGGPSSRSSWRRISSIARLSWSVSGGSSGYFIAMASLRLVACTVPTIRVPPGTLAAAWRGRRGSAIGPWSNRVRPAVGRSARGAAAQQSLPGAARPLPRARSHRHHTRRPRRRAVGSQART